MCHGNARHLRPLRPKHRPLAGYAGKQSRPANVLLCIASTGYADPDGADIGIYRIPGGEFHLNRCATLLNMYLMATYGEGQYVEGFYNQQIYLNHKLIEEKQLNLAEIQQSRQNFWCSSAELTKYIPPTNYCWVPGLRRWSTYATGSTATAPAT